MKQATFDWDRAEQLGLIERWECPKLPGVSAGACKAVLRAIDGFGRGREAWPSETTLAAVCGVSVRTVRRAVRALSGLSLLVVERRGPQTVNHYRIVWTELALLVPGRANMPPRERSNQRPATQAERPATVSERPATVSERPATVAAKTTRTIQETTTTANPPVVVVSRLEALGLARAREAAAAAMAHGLEIEPRIRAFEALPADKRRPGVLYNWLSNPRSFRGQAEEQTRRGPTLAQLESQYRLEQVRLVRGMRSRGEPEDMISAAVEKFEAVWAERLSRV